jgi:hypothetical protein
LGGGDVQSPSNLLADPLAAAAASNFAFEQLEAMLLLQQQQQQQQQQHFQQQLNSSNAFGNSMLDGLLLNHAATEVMNHTATNAAVANSTNNNAATTAYTKQIPVKAAAGRPTLNDAVDKVHCECGGTHLSPHTTKGAASWRNHVLTKRHQKFLQHQQLQQQLQQQHAAEQDEDEHEYDQSDMNEELAANAVPVTSFSIGPNSNDSGDGNSLYTGEPV